MHSFYPPPTAPVSLEVVQAELHLWTWGLLWARGTLLRSSEPGLPQGRENMLNVQARFRMEAWVPPGNRVGGNEECFRVKPDGRFLRFFLVTELGFSLSVRGRVGSPGPFPGPGGLPFIIHSLLGHDGLGMNTPCHSGQSCREKPAGDS